MGALGAVVTAAAAVDVVIARVASAVRGRFEDGIVVSPAGVLLAGSKAVRFRSWQLFSRSLADFHLR